MSAVPGWMVVLLALSCIGCGSVSFFDREARQLYGAPIQGRHYSELVDRLGEPQERSSDGRGGRIMSWTTGPAPSAQAPSAQEPDILTVWAGPDGMIYRWKVVRKPSSSRP